MSYHRSLLKTTKKYKLSYFYRALHHILRLDKLKNRKFGHLSRLTHILILGKLKTENLLSTGNYFGFLFNMFQEL